MTNLGPETVITVDTDSTVTDAVDKLEVENIGTIVVEADNEPVGILTDRDIALALTDTEDIATESVGTIMTTDPVTIAEDEEAMEISRKIEEHNIRRIPVVDEDGNLSGIVTLDDLVSVVGEQLDNVASTIEVQSPEYSP